MQRDPEKRPTAAKLLKHRFFKFNRHARDATEEVLARIPGPVKRTESLRRRKNDAAKAETPLPGFPFAGDELIPLHDIKVHYAA